MRYHAERGGDVSCREPVWERLSGPVITGGTSACALGAATISTPALKAMRHFQRIPIAPMMRAFARALAGPFKGLAPDVTEENLQARIRGNLLMALSNKFGWLVLTTGNKSEMSVGYATLYGDMAGGYSVLKDVYKTEVYALARWRNEHVPEGGLGPAGRVIPESSLTRAPTAELRPNQTDQDTLPPYPMLDAIMEAYVQDDLAPLEIIARGFERADVERVVRMVRASEYKRRQAPIGIRITPRGFGKDWRFPITNKFRHRFG